MKKLKTGMKSRWVKMSMMAMLLTVSASGAALAESPLTEPQRAKNEVITVTKALPAIHIANHVGMTMLALPQHERQYWKLLVKEYAPELSDAWGAALLERKQVEDSAPKIEPVTVQLKPGLKPPFPEGTAVESITDENGKQVAVYRLNQVDGNAIPTDEAIKVFHKEHSGNETTTIVVAAADKLMIQPFQEDGGNGIINKEPSAEIGRIIKLNEAVDAEDQEAIRSLLPELLEDYRKQTEELKNAFSKLEELKVPATESIESE